MEQLGNDFSTTLAAAITTVGQTAITVASGAGAPDANFRIRIGDEWMLVTSKGSGTDWTVTRGIEGSTATTHLNGADVAHVLTVGGLAQYLIEWGPLQMVPQVPANETRTVPAGTRLVVHEGFEVYGALNLEGEALVL